MRLQILAQPFFFHRSLLAATDLGAFAIEHHDVPRSEVIAVITFSGIAGRRAEIIEVGSGTSGMELVVADGGARPPLLPAPGGIVALRKLLCGAALVCVVACGKNSSRNAVQKLGRRFRARKIGAVGDIACADEDGGRLVIFLASCGFAPMANIRTAQNSISRNLELLVLFFMLRVSF